MADTLNTGDGAEARLHAALAAQKAALLRDGPASAALRKDRLTRAINLLLTYRERFNAAMALDFGRRSADQSDLGDLMSSVSALKHARAHVERWMRPERRSPEPPFGLLGGRAEIRFQAKGVVGLISPWNFPVNLTFGPLAGIFAAGNRVMIKPSEFTPATSDAMARAFAGAFDVEEVAVVQGGPEVGAAFSRLPFDHLLFTGATSVGRHVMRAAAENLVPVTLELGGKSPVVVGESADLDLTARRVWAGKTLNAGQICLAPDYVLVPEASRDAFVAASQRAVGTMFPTVRDNPDYTAIINERHVERLRGYLADAEAKGARTVSLAPQGEDFSQTEHRIIPPTILLDVTPDMKVMQDEIFGPILPVVTYRGVGEAIGQINAGPKPLGLYYFGADAAEREHVLERTSSGGVTVNDVIMHIGHEDLPFGGVGPSGMGSYHGRDGFVEFSHRRSVYHQIKPDLLGMLRPPYGKQFRQIVASRMKP